jgi:protoporphyrinogen oxidase
LIDSARESGAGADLQIVIVGAGITGLCAARALRAHPNVEFHIYERDSEPGGLCRTRHRDGFTFDHVNHVLHFRSERGKQFVQNLVGEQLASTERNAGIFYKGRFVPYPFQDHLGYLPIGDKLECSLGLLKVWTQQALGALPAPRNFAEWCSSTLGAGILRTFMQPYNRKVWGDEPEQLDVDWMGSFVPTVEPIDVVGSFFRRRANLGYSRQFLYLRSGGTQPLIHAASSDLPVQTNRTVRRVDTARQIVEFADGSRVRYDMLISTIPLTHLVASIDAAPAHVRAAASHLRSTSVMTLTYAMTCPLSHDYHWLYFPEPHYPFFRLTFPSNINPAQAPAGCGLISAEISQPDVTKADSLQDEVTRKLTDIGLLPPASKIEFVERHLLPFAYPVHDLHRRAACDGILQFLQQRNILSIGRFGGWQYSGLDENIVSGLEAADQVLGQSECPASLQPGMEQWAQRSRSSLSNCATDTSSQ